MTDLLPKQSDVTANERVPRVVGLDEESAHAVFSGLSSRTARVLLANLYREPETISALAERTDVSLQTVSYHINRLEALELVEVVDTWYSVRGNEMDVYAPTNDPLLLGAGDLDQVRRVLVALYYDGEADPDVPDEDVVGLRELLHDHVRCVDASHKPFLWDILEDVIG